MGITKENGPCCLQTNLIYKHIFPCVFLECVDKYVSYWSKVLMKEQKVQGTVGTPVWYLLERGKPSGASVYSHSTLGGLYVLIL